MTRHNYIFWSANYHAIFGAFDDRSRLTWRGRFADVPTLTEMYNFYSSGDEVLELGPQDISILTGVSDSLRRYVWHKQENFKGRSWLYGTGWAGWGFEAQWQTSESANAMTLQQLQDSPVFENDPAELFSGTINHSKRNEILAHGIPALSRATGVQDIASEFNILCLDMDNTASVTRKNGWCRNSILYGDRWLHTDVQNVPFFFTHSLYFLIKEKICQ